MKGTKSWKDGEECSSLLLFRMHRRKERLVEMKEQLESPSECLTLFVFCFSLQMKTIFNDGKTQEKELSVWLSSTLLMLWVVGFFLFFVGNRGNVNSIALG